MDKNVLRVLRLVIVFASLANVMPVSAGDLNPPPGPIAATHRTPINASTTPGDFDSVFKIASPGSYYLTGNITGANGKNGIEITASGVTLDLMGFDVVGALGSFTGIRATAAVSDIAVVNGSVRNWEAGLNLSSASNIRLADLRVSGNGVGGGMYIGPNAVITGCSAYLNQQQGIRVMGSASMTGCSARNNTTVGIQVEGGTITNCSAHFNGDDGFVVHIGSTITNCSAVSNTGDGIAVGQSCVARGNNCHGNGVAAGVGAGIRAMSVDARIEGNNCVNNDVGIEVDSASNLIISNTCAGNLLNYDIVSSNRYGPIIDATGGPTAAASGNSAPSNMLSTDPWANIAH